MNYPGNYPSLTEEHSFLVAQSQGHGVFNGMAFNYSLDFSSFLQNPINILNLRKYFSLILLVM